MDALSLAQLLWADSSPYAICKGQWRQLLEACDVAISTAGDAFAQRTAKSDLSHYSSRDKYCDTMGIAAMRPQVDPVRDRVAYMREVVLLVNALTYFVRSKKDRMIKPPSAMDILLGATVC